MNEVFQIFIHDLSSIITEWSTRKISMIMVLLIYTLYRYFKFKKSKKERYEMQWKKMYKTVPPVYPNGWYCLLDSQEISAGQIKSVSALGEDFVVIRGEDGNVRILSAICPSLQANIPTADNVSKICETYPSDGWKFDSSNGRHVSIPYWDNISAEEKLKAWYSCEVNTVIYVWYHVENEEPPWYPEVIPIIRDNIWRCRQTKEYQFNSHIQDITENGADVTHFLVVHKPITSSKWWPRIGKFQWRSKWYSEKEIGKKHVAIMNFEVSYTLLRFSRLISTAKTILDGPGTLIIHVNGIFGPFMVLQTVTPIEPFAQKSVYRAFYSPISAMLVELIGFTLFLDQVENDLTIWNNKIYLDKPLLTKQEENIRKYRQWYKQFYSENSPRFQEIDFY